MSSIFDYDFGRPVSDLNEWILDTCTTDKAKAKKLIKVRDALLIRQEQYKRKQRQLFEKRGTAW